MINQLGSEQSPYLQQHRDNPVHWQPWGVLALEKAAEENKLVIVSIGYSTCHWCHVMERESFENPEVADLMNRHYVSIKVDREERPDIDQIYMTAVQLMTNSGGWPLNCICLPDGRPIYGGTYFHREQWMNILTQLQELWEEQPETALEYAEKLANGIRDSERLPIHTTPTTFAPEQLHNIARTWKKQFDTTHGGNFGAPKFPMPTNWNFLLQYGILLQDQEVVDHVHFTLKKIASGGIYDHVGGGFSRYSVDDRWHVPHFEKMLYDNAQLISLYLSAWQQRADPQYERVVRETLEWVHREMTSPEGGFYCALDADSEGVEGKFYTFTHADFQKLREQGMSDSDQAFLWAYFQFSEEGNWPEEGTNVLYHESDADQLSSEHLQALKTTLRNYRSARVRPGLDHKQLTSWNALMLKALCESYRVLNEPIYLERALKNAAFIQSHLYSDHGGLYHQPVDSNRIISGFLDDYACTIDAFIRLYEATFDEHYLQEAKRLADYCMQHFLDLEEGIFYYTDEQTPTLIARKYELLDNVIPSSNSILFRALQKLGVIFEESEYEGMISKVLSRLIPQMNEYGPAFANWAILLLHEVVGHQEIILSGKQGDAMRRAVDEQYIPNKVVLGGTQSEVPILRNRLSEQNLAYLCKNRTCSLPVNTTKDLLALLTT